MTEPNKIYLSGCQESQSFYDTHFSRQFKYKMNSLPKDNKLRRLLLVLCCIVLAFILGFLLIGIGIFLYPTLIVHCNKQFDETEIQDSEIHGYVTTFGQILSNLGICKQPYNNTFNENGKLKSIDTDNLVSPKVQNRKPNETDECICSNIYKTVNVGSNESETDKKRIDGHVTKDIECACGEKLDIPDSYTNESNNASIKYENIMKTLNNEVLYNITNFDFNKTETENTALKKVVESRNVTILKNISKDNLNDSKILIDYPSLLKENCKCPKTRNMTYILFNGTRLNDEMHTIDPENAECECPKINDNNYMLFNESGSGNNATGFTSVSNEECICPLTYASNASTDEYHKLGTNTKNGECVCPETLNTETSNANFNAAHRIKNYDAAIFNSTENIEAINFPFDEKESSSDSHSNKSNKCTCPKPYEIAEYNFDGTEKALNNSELSIDDECKCPVSEEHEDISFELNEPHTEDNTNVSELLPSGKCTCPERPKLLINESREGENRLDFETKNGECLCPQVLDQNYTDANETEYMNEKVLSINHENDLKNVKQLTNDHITQYGNEPEISVQDESVTDSSKVQRKGDENEGVKEHVVNFDDENVSINSEEVTKVYDEKNVYEESLTTADKMETSSVTHDYNE